MEPAERKRGDVAAGFTLVEVMVALLLAALAAGGVYRGLFVCRGLNQANAQRVVAFGLCSAQLEHVKGMGYEEVVPGGFALEPSVPLTHLGGIHHVPVVGARNTTVRELANPVRKEVVVRVDWTFRGRALTEQLTGLVYPK